MPEPTSEPTQDIYKRAALAYLDAGWAGPLPLPPGKKQPVPAGFTGRAGEWPNGPDIYTWLDMYPTGNIALRLPENVIGIDIDAYPGKPGAATLIDTEHAWGALPPTWRTTSRDDGVSGIRLYVIPEGLEWPNDVGPGIEIIRYAHRYAIVWPSIHPDTGHTYKWVADDNLTHIGTIPTIDELPTLPTAWVHGLTHGRADNREARTPLTTPEAQAALTLFNTGEPCRDVTRALTKRVQDLTNPGHGSRHDIMLVATERLVRLGIAGHTGITTALTQLRTAFLTAVTGERAPGEAEAEWDRSLQGALANVHTVDTVDPCVDPFHGLIDRATTATQNAPKSATELLQHANPANPAPTPPGGEHVDEPEVKTAAPSWEPVDLTGYIDGTYQPPTPTMLTRTDGPSLIYPGLVHDLHGESESGKSLVAQWEVATRLLAGGTATYIDFESDPGQIVDRLRLMGVPDTTIDTHFTYIRPEASPYAATELDAWANLLTNLLDLVILDGVTDALGQFGGSTKENDDIATWHRMVPRTLATRTGAAVILIDHVTKNGDTRGRFALGGQAKMASIDGASYTVEVAEPIGKGLRGTVVLRVAKDRPGAIRPHCGKWRAVDRTQEAARVTVDSTDPDAIVMHVEPPNTTVTDGIDNDGQKPRTDRDTWLMEQISRAIEASAEPISGNRVAIVLGKNKTRVLELIRRLEDADHVTRKGDGWKSTNVYRERNDPTSPRFEPGVADVI